MRCFSRSGLAAIMLSSGLGWMAHGHAATFTSFQLLPTFGGSTDPVISETVSNPTGVQERQTGGAYGTGIAQYGVLKALSRATSTGAESYFAEVTAGFQDRLTFNTSGGPVSALAEVLLEFDRSFSFNGERATLDSGYASARLNFGTSTAGIEYIETFRPPVVAACAGSTSQGCAPVVTAQSTGDIGATWLSPSTLKLVVPITTNATQAWALNLRTTGFAGFENLNASRIWTADAFNSLYWGGISRVLSEQGTEIDFQVTSESGTDYRQSFVPAPAPVPEPSTYLLLALGLLGLATVLQTKRGWRAS